MFSQLCKQNIDIYLNCIIFTVWYDIVRTRLVRNMFRFAFCIKDNIHFYFFVQLIDHYVHSFSYHLHFDNTRYRLGPNDFNMSKYYKLTHIGNQSCNISDIEFNIGTL